MVEAAAVLGIISATLAILVTFMKIWQSGAQKKSYLDSSALLWAFNNLARKSIRYGLTSSQVEELRSANVDAFRDPFKEFRNDAVNEETLVDVMKEFRNDAVHRIYRDGITYSDFEDYLKLMLDSHNERMLLLGELSMTLTKEESLKLRMEMAREAEKNERNEPVPDCPETLSSLIRLVPREYLEEFGAEEYINHVRDELQNASLKGKSKYRVMFERLLEFTLYIGKRQLLRLQIKRRSSIK